MRTTSDLEPSTTTDSIRETPRRVTTADRAASLSGVDGLTPSLMRTQEPVVNRAAGC